MSFLKFNPESYEDAIDFIFNLDTSTEELDFKKLKILFKEFGNGEKINKSIITALQNHYLTKTLTKENLKAVDLEHPIAETQLTDSLKKSYKVDEKLNLNNLIINIQKLNNTIDKDKFISFIKREIYNNPNEQNFDYKVFEDSLLNFLKK